MAMQTKRFDGSAVKKEKPFSWSYTKMKNFEVCPKRHYETDILKNYNDGDDNETLKHGELVHDALAKRCQEGTPLPTGYDYEHWAQRVLAGGGEIYTELELAIDQNFGPAPWFQDYKDPSKPIPWYRAKVDLVKKVGPIALLVDWKTGKIAEDSFQLALSAACAFARWPDLQAIRCSFIWLKEDAESSETFYRADMAGMWRQLWPRIQKLHSAHQLQDYPPTPSRMCRKWCKVVSCPNHGKSFST